MRYLDYYLSVFKKYNVFSGRANRAEFWYFALFNAIVIILLGQMRSLSSIYQLVAFIPSLSVSVRRMHDVDKSGWFLLIPIYSIILMATKGTEGKNKYGAAPKED